MEYGIAIKNRFHHLSDDEGADPLEILGKASQIKKAKGTSITKVPQNTAPVSQQLPKPDKPEKQQPEIANKENNSTRGRGRGGARGNTREGGNVRRDDRHRDENRRDDRNRDETRRETRRPEGAEGERKERRFEGERKVDGERRGRGRGGNRGNFTGERRPRLEGDATPIEGEDKPEGERRPFRGGGGGSRGGRGTYRSDRADRTGLRGEPKKDGFGKGNWGTQKDELKGETEPVGEATEVVEKPTEEENTDKNDSGVEVEKEEEKPVGMTFMEWKEKNKPTETESFNVRKPEDAKKLNLAPLKRNEDADKDAEEFVVLRRENKKKHVDISVNFTTADRGFNNRGARDGFRGRGEGRGRGGDNRRGPAPSRGNDRSRGNNFNAKDDQKFFLKTDQFPAL